MTTQQQKRLAELENKPNLTKQEKIEIEHLKRVAKVLIIKK